MSVTFTTGKRGSTHRYCLDKKRNDKSYWKCVNQSTCKARLTYNQLSQEVSQIPEHTHEGIETALIVHQRKQELKKSAATANQPTKELVADAVTGLDQECLANLGCQLSSLSRMARKSRVKAALHPVAPTSLGDLVIPSTHFYSKGNPPERMLLWDIVLNFAVLSFLAQLLTYKFSMNLSIGLLVAR